MPRDYNNILRDFIINILEKTENPEDFVTILDLHDKLRTWYKYNYDGKCANMKDFRTYLRKEISSYDPINDYIACYRFKSIFCTNI